MLHYLLPVQDGIFVDCTVGGGGHARAILERVSIHSRLIAFDVDEDALSHASRVLEPYKERVLFIHSNFSKLREMLEHHNIQSVDGILLDLGVSSYQIDEPSRGFSFQVRGALDMRMNKRQPFSAYDVVHTYTVEQLADILWKYGEERHSRKIARAIVEERKRSAISTTDALAQIVQRCVSRQHLQKTLARVFQALRIEVNKELDNVQRVLIDGIDVLKSGGRIVVLSYHSLEDRIVKETFKEAGKGAQTGDSLHGAAVPTPRVRILTKKPIVPSTEEIQKNPRARSAKLRVAEKV